MTTFDERKDQLEKKYFHEEELLFKTKSRRNKLLGLEIAARLGKTGEDAAEYAKKLVVAAALDPSGDEGLHKLIAGDLAAAGKPMSVQELNALLGELFTRAMQEIRAE